MSAWQREQISVLPPSSLYAAAISSSQNMQRQLSSSSGDDRDWCPFSTSLSHTPPPLLHFQYPLPPLFVLSHYQGIILSTKASTRRYGLCSPFPSALLSPRPSLISSVLLLNSIKKGIFRFRQVELYGSFKNIYL